MKIDPNNPILKQLLGGASTTAKGTGDARFGDILGQAMKSPNAEKSAASSLELTQSISGIQLKAALSEGATGVTGQVEELLDALETYRQMLSDPGTTLKEMASVVDQMETQCDKLAEMADALEAGDDLKDLANQTLVTASTEIMKFKKGDYIDA